MRAIKTFGLAALAALAFGAVAAAAASAHSFSATGELPTTFVAKQTSNQVFTTSLGTITCETLEGEGAVTAATFESLTADVTYSVCTANTNLFGTYKVKNVHALYLFDANNSVSVLKPIEIELEGLCTVTVPEQLLDEAVTYEDKGTELALEAHAEKIHWEGCFSSGENGTYSGNSLGGLLNGGTASWS